MLSMPKFICSIALPLLLGPAHAHAQTLQIADVKVRLFLQLSGEFSSPLTGNEDLWNVVAGGGSFPEPTSSAFVDVAVAGSAGKFVAGQLIHLVVTNNRTGKVVHRLTGRTGVFGPAGRTHVGFWLPAVGCDSLLLVASTAGSSKSQSLPFRCGE